MTGPLIVTAEFSADDLAWLQSLRRAHYPLERNRVPAHLTIFRALPPSAEDEVRSRLAAKAAEPPPRASIEGLLDLGGGVALRVVSPDLDQLRERLANELHGLLGAQDSSGWRPHVTIQNKVAPKVARTLHASLEPSMRRRPLRIAGIGLHRYSAGGWDRLATWPFRGVR